MIAAFCQARVQPEWRPEIAGAAREKRMPSAGFTAVHLY
jgi:hypothetical protein